MNAGGMRVATSFTSIAIGLSSLSLAAQTWPQWLVSGPSPQRSSMSVACSGDLGTLVAAGTPGAYVSTDFGATWQLRGPGSYWDVVCSANGRSMILSDNGILGTLVSTNSGSTWKQLPLFYDAATSADGRKMVGVGGSTCYLTRDFGATWSTNNIWSPHPGCFLQCVASSADGNTLVGGSYMNTVYVSTNSGATWEPTTAPQRDWWIAACSVDGTHFAAVADDVPSTMWVSTNSGITWNQASFPGGHQNNLFPAVGFSADDSRLVEVVDDSSVWSSVDGGATWTMVLGTITNGPGANVAFSSNADKFVGCGYGLIYTAGILPSLDIRHSGENLMLSWPTPLVTSNTALQYAPDLRGTNWFAVTNQPTSTNGRSTVALPVSGGVGFYRLHLQ